jgi:hypothetical protein
MKASSSKSTKASVGKKRSRSEAKGSAPESSPPSSPHPNPAKEWKKSKLNTEDLLALVNSGFSRQKEMDLWRATTGHPYLMERGLVMTMCGSRTGRWSLPAVMSD